MLPKSFLNVKKNLYLRWQG